MPIDKLIDILVPVTLFEMMATLGLGVAAQQVMAVARNWSLLGRAGIANYALVPVCAVILLLLFHPPAMIAAGFLIAAACPGAPYGPPFTALAKGDVSVAIGLMVVLAGSSAILSPVVLHLTLPLASGKPPLDINVFKIGSTLLVTQLLPLGAGMAIRELYPRLANTLLKPGKYLSIVLNLVVFALILSVHYHVLLRIRPVGFVGMAVLALASVAFGWVLGGGHGGDRTALAFLTGVRNAGVSLVIATSSFPGTATVTATLAYALFQTIFLALLAASWTRWRRRTSIRTVKS
jgi:BASS family bile acid:Na+ symporter